MDYNKFEDRISSWIEGDLDLKDRKEFEAFLAENPEYQSKVDEVRNIISRMRESDSLKLSEEFDKKLAEKIDSLNVGVTDEKSNDIFGFSRQNFAYLTLSLSIASVSPSPLLSECPIKVYLAPTLFNM